MRPVRLEIEGFASYLAPTAVDFDGLRLLAVVGSTGSGKSSLLDAITFALYGKTRAGSVDSVVNTKGIKAAASFTFELGERTYRASRVRVFEKTTGVTFEVRVVDGDTLRWEPVGDGQVRGTDDKIRQVLGMSYETFVATVFLGQGDADRFTADSTPRARKEILSEILGLDAYGQVANAATDTFKHMKATAEALVDQSEAVGTEMDGREDDEVALAGARSAQASCQARAESARGELSLLQNEVHALRGAEERIAGLERNIVSLRERRAGERRRAERRAKDAAAALASLRQGKARADQKVSEAKSAAAAAERLAAQRDAALRKQRSAEKTVERLLSEGTAIAGDLASLRAEVAGAERRLGESEVHLSAVSADSDNPVCYTCGQEVSARRRADMVAGLSEDIRRIGDELAGLRASLAAKEAERAKKLSEYSEAKTEHANLGARLDKLVREHEQAAAKVGGVGEAGTDADALGEQISEAEELLVSAEENLRDLDGDDPDEAALAAQIAEEKEKLAAGGDTRAAFAAASADVRAAEKALEDVTRDLGRLEEKVARYTELETRLSALDKRRSALADEIAVQETLARAFGRDGIPAMILNSVVAELDAVVNDVLGRLSGGSLNARVETQREKKTGGVADTLEVIVSDGVTDRPYSTFSGGERFKVDLALRVGLAKLLSRRSGTPIRTLAIDEGWGSLDPEGTQALVECLHELASDFDCLITISHVPAVAEAFSARLVVSKSPSGSSVAVTVS